MRSGTHTHIGGACPPKQATATRTGQGKPPTPQGATSHRTQQGGSHGAAWRALARESRPPVPAQGADSHGAAARAHEAFYRTAPCEAVSPPHARRLALRTRRLALPCEPADSHDAPRSIDRATEGVYPNRARGLPQPPQGVYLSRRNGFTRRVYPPLTTHGAPPFFLLTGLGP